MKEQILDFSMAPPEEFINIKRGYDLFLTNTKRERYFGYVDKKELKYICKHFGYVNPKTFLQGCVFGAGALLIYQMYVSSKEDKLEKE